MERTPNRKIPIIILLVILLAGTLIVFFSMNEKQKQAFLNSFKTDPLGISATQTEQEETIIEKDIGEIISFANKQMEDTQYLTCRIYKNEILHKNNIETWSLNKLTGIYKYNDEYYIDLYNNICYYIDNGKWYKKDNDITIDIDTKKYTIPKDAIQLEDDKIDGVNCYVLYDGTKYYYIKKSTEMIVYIKEINNDNTYFYQFTFSEIDINEKIVENAIQK